MQEITNDLGTSQRFRVELIGNGYMLFVEQKDEDYRSGCIADRRMFYCKDKVELLDGIAGLIERLDE